MLQSRLKSLEKKGQQILVIKKLLKKKEDKLRNEKHAASSDGTISSRRKFIATWSPEAVFISFANVRSWIYDWKCLWASCDFVNENLFLIDFLESLKNKFFLLEIGVLVWILNVNVENDVINRDKQNNDVITPDF